MVVGTALLLSSSILFTSCIGSFGLFNRLLSWNKSVGDKWVNELVFILLCIVPAYEIAWAIDILVLNTIEFWTDSNPALEAQVKEVETENGLITITTDANGHKIQKAGSEEVVEFRFNEDEKSWSIVAEEEETKLFSMVNEAEAMVYLADGSTMTISADQAGLFALEQVVKSKAYFANK